MFSLFSGYDEFIQSELTERVPVGTGHASASNKLGFSGAEGAAAATLPGPVWAEAEYAGGASVGGEESSGARSDAWGWLLIRPPWTPC